jgi:hypothetical protein
MKEELIDSHALGKAGGLHGIGNGDVNGDSNDSTGEIVSI